MVAVWVACINGLTRDRTFPTVCSQPMASHVKDRLPDLREHSTAIAKAICCTATLQTNDTLSCTCRVHHEALFSGQARKNGGHLFVRSQPSCLLNCSRWTASFDADRARFQSISVMCEQRLRKVSEIAPFAVGGGIGTSAYLSTSNTGALSRTLF